MLREIKDNENNTETAKKNYRVYGYDVNDADHRKLVFKVSIWRYVFERWTQTRMVGRL